MIIKNLTKVVAIVVLTIAAPFASFAKEKSDTITARQAFINMPATVLDLLDKSTRMDMLDYFDTDSIWSAINEYNGMSRLQTVTPDYLSVEITPVSNLQIKILEDKKGNDVVMTIYTTGKPGETLDSDIRFYNTAMQELPTAKYLELPKLKDFFEFPKGSSTKMKEIEELLPFYSVNYKAAPGNNTVTGELITGDFVNLEDKKIVTLFLKPEIQLFWDGNKLKYKKQ